MDPRLKSSVKWSPFPKELCAQTQKVLKKRFQEEYDLEKSQFVVEGRIYREEILGRYGLRVNDQLKQHNFEISFEFDSKKQKVLELIHKSMDLVEHLWTELLEENLDDSDLSKQWQTINFDRRKYFHRYSTVNTALEEEADRLLSQYKKKLVYDDPDKENTTDNGNKDNKNNGNPCEKLH